MEVENTQQAPVENAGDQNSAPVENSTVDRRAYEQVKNDMGSFKKKWQESQSAIDALQRKLEQVETEKAKSQGQYKELYEQALEKAKEKESRLSELSNAWQNEKKYTAIEREAMQLGLRKEALEDIWALDAAGVLVERTDQGRVNVLGAKEYVEQLKSSKPHWFQDSTPPNVNNGQPAPNYNEKSYTARELLKLQKENPAAYREEMMKRLKA